MEQLTLQQKFYNATHLTWSIDDFIASAGDDVEKKRDVLRTVAWLIPDGAAQDAKDIAADNVAFLNEVGAELGITDFSEVWIDMEDFNKDGKYDGYDCITSEELTGSDE